MLCEDIYGSALAILGESQDTSDNADYEERAPYLIAAFCSEAQETDKEWRNSLSLDAQSTWDPVCISLDELFPLSDRFASAAAFFVAAMLVVDSNETLYDKLYDRFCESMSAIDSSIAEPEPEEFYILESITNKYF